MSVVVNGSRGDIRYQIGEWIADPKEGTLVGNGTTKKLAARTMNVLVYFAERASKTVTHEELLKVFWPRSSEAINAVHKCIAELRQAFGVVGQESKYLETVPKRGYRLVAAVTFVDADVVAEQARGPIVFSIGTRTAVIKPVNAGGSTARGKTFAQRIRGELVTHLNRLTSASMRSHTAAGDLNFHYAVDFDVQDIDSQMQATVAITPASNEWPSYQERFDSSVVVHERITHVVDTLTVLLDVDHVGRMREWGTRNVDAYRDAFEAELLVRSESFAGTKRAVDLFVRALEKDPRFAMAYGSLAHAYHNMGMTAKDTPTREQVRQHLQALHRQAKQWQIDPEAILVIERQTRFVSLVNPFDAEAFWRAEIIKDPSNADAIRRYGDLLLGSKLIDESAAYLARSIALTDEDSRDWVEQDEVNLAGARGEVERGIALLKRNLDRFPDHTMSTFGLVRALAKLGRYAEAEFYLSRLVATDATWAFFGRMVLMAIRGDVPPGSNQLAHLFADPLANNTNRGFICFILGDVEAGVRYWREIEPGFLPLLWQFNGLNERLWAPGVVEDPRYQTLLDELGFGRRWRAYMRSKVAELTSITGIEVTTPLPPEDVSTTTRTGSRTASA